jgi:hypothetical protein
MPRRRISRAEGFVDRKDLRRARSLEQQFRYQR